MSNNYRLQLRHGIESRTFNTRGDVFAYLNGQIQYGGLKILPHEPILFYYGSDTDKKTIIAIGLPEGKVHNGNSFFLIDVAELDEKVTALDKKYSEAIKQLPNVGSGDVTEAKNSIADLTRKLTEEIDGRKEKDQEISNKLASEVIKLGSKDVELEKGVTISRSDIKSLVEACGLYYNDKMTDGRVSYRPNTHDEVIRDATSVADAIEKISEFARTVSNDLKLATEVTETVNLELSKRSDGNNLLKANLRLAGSEGLSKRIYDNNILGVTSDGLYCSTSIEPNPKKPNTLVFKTSGYVNGRFMVDAYETEIPIATYLGDEGLTTGVLVNVNPDTNVISAKLKLSSSPNNILRFTDGSYLVDGSSVNIKHGDSTVYSLLEEHKRKLEEYKEKSSNLEFIGASNDTSTVNVTKSASGVYTISNEVKLGRDSSIITSDGGLKANVSMEYLIATSQLVLNVGKNKTTIDLSGLGVAILEDTQYNAANEEIILKFKVGESTKTLTIPVGKLVHDFDVNDSDTINFELKSVVGGPNIITGDVKLDKTRVDNLLTSSNNGLLVSSEYITRAVSQETASRKETEAELKKELSKINELVTRINDTVETSLSTLRAKVNVYEGKFIEFESKLRDFKSILDEAPSKADIDKVKNSVSIAIDDLEKIKKVIPYATYTNPKNLVERVNEVETKANVELPNTINDIKNNVIGPKNGSVPGTVWNELNNLIDVGTY